MGAENVTLGLALIAGFLSFISPCVLPLVPAYIGYMGGRMTHTAAANVAADGAQVREKRKNDAAVRANMFLHGVAFVLGFTVIFVLIGIATTALVGLLGGSVSIITDVIGRLGGVMIIIFGLHFMGVLQRLFNWLKGQQQLIASPLFTVGVGLALSVVLLWGLVDLVIGSIAVAALWLALVASGATARPGAFWTELIERIEAAFYSDTRRDLEPNGRQGLVGSFLMGVVFSAGWTPCIGPLLGTILTLAANTGEVSSAVPLLTAYSLGLGIPFIITALLMDSAQGLLRRLQRHMRTIELVSGGLLVGIGILVASGQLTVLSTNLSNQFADLSARVEECGIGFFEGEVGLSHLGPCLGGSLHVVVLNQSAVITFDEAEQTFEYLFRLEEAQAIDVEVIRPTDNLMADFVLVDAANEVIAESSSFERYEEETWLAMRNVALDAGQYLVRVSNTGGDLATDAARFRLKIVSARPEAPAATGAAEADSAVPTEDVRATTGAGPAVQELAQESQGLGLNDLNSIVGLAEQSGPAIGLDVGERAPNFTVTTLAGEEVRLTDLRGQVVLLNFWGTWCGPCRREMPEFQELYEELHSEGFTILALAVRDNEDDMREFRDEFGLTFPLALDEDNQISRDYAIPGQPSSLILDPNGVIRFKTFTIVTRSQLQPYLDEAFAAAAAE